MESGFVSNFQRAIFEQLFWSIWTAYTKPPKQRGFNESPQFLIMSVHRGHASFFTKQRLKKFHLVYHEWPHILIRVDFHKKYNWWNSR